jgi:8-oxo-dGTP diphosphatase
MPEPMSREEALERAVRLRLEYLANGSGRLVNHLATELLAVQSECEARHAEEIAAKDRMIEALKAKLQSAESLIEKNLAPATVGLLKRAEEAEAHAAALAEALNLGLDGNRAIPVDREMLGALVRRVWVHWARAQLNPKPHWLTEWSDLPETDREVDRQIGETVARYVLVGDAASRSLAADIALTPDVLKLASEHAAGQKALHRIEHFMGVIAEAGYVPESHNGDEFEQMAQVLISKADNADRAHELYEEARHEIEAWRGRNCLITGNPCGTDSLAVGVVCACVPCTQHREAEALRAQVASLTAVLQGVMEQVSPCGSEDCGKHGHEYCPWGIAYAALTAAPQTLAAKARHVYPTLVVCALIVQDGKVLLERRAPAGVQGLDLMWDLPGGKIEIGESPADALVREIREELAVEVQPVTLLPELYTSVWTYPDGRTLHWVLAVYLCDLRGEPTLNANLQWHQIAGLTEETVLAPDLQAIRSAAKARQAQEDSALLEAWFEHTTWIIVQGYPVDPRVQVFDTERGDLEWVEVGRGATPRAALRDAIDKAGQTGA